MAKTQKEPNQMWNKWNKQNFYRKLNKLAACF